MKMIWLTQGQFTLVDDEDYPGLSMHKWYTKKSGKTLYAYRSIGGRLNPKDIPMHSVILNLLNTKDKKIEADHRDGNGLNNQKYNLRESTRSQNCSNRKTFTNSTSGNKGVYFLKGKDRWRARIQKGGKRIYIGDYKTNHEAALAYNSAAIQLHGEFANLNKV